jgi:hypothetical protein
MKARRTVVVSARLRRRYFWLADDVWIAGAGSVFDRAVGGMKVFLSAAFPERYPA